MKNNARKKRLQKTLTHTHTLSLQNIVDRLNVKLHMRLCNRTPTVGVTSVLPNCSFNFFVRKFFSSAPFLTDFRPSLNPPTHLYDADWDSIASPHYLTQHFSNFRIHLSQASQKFDSHFNFFFKSACTFTLNYNSMHLQYNDWTDQGENSHIMSWRVYNHTPIVRFASVLPYRWFNFLSGNFFDIPCIL